MSELVIVEKSDLVSIADKIRERTGDTKGLAIGEMTTAIDNIGADFTELESKLSNGFTDYSYHFFRHAMNEVPTEILQHTSNGTNFYYMFANSPNLTAVPQFDTSNGMDFGGMLYNCAKITAVPQFDTSNGTNFDRMLYGCSVLITVGGIDLSSATIVTNMFFNCPSLENITINGVIKISGLVLSSCGKLTHTSLMSIINALYDWAANSGTGTYKLTLGSTNLAKLTDAEKAIATQKGWTLA